MGSEASKILVVYFSASGNTRTVAEKTAKMEVADLYEIVTAVPYAKEDLDHNDRNSRNSIECSNPMSWPEIGSENISLDSYSVVYIGYPIWWEPFLRLWQLLWKTATFPEKLSFHSVHQDQARLARAWTA